MFRFLTSGESHGKGLNIIIEGVPAGLSLSEADIAVQLARRQLGYGRGGRMKIRARPRRDHGGSASWSHARESDFAVHSEP